MIMPLIIGITRPTGVTDTAATLIDNIFCNNLLDHSPINGLLYTNIFDYLPIFTIIPEKANTKPCPEISYY